MKILPRAYRFFSIALLLAATSTGVTLTGCGGGGGDDGDDGTIGVEQAKVVGQAILPAQIQPNNAPAANAPFQVVDFQRSQQGTVVATGQTDANGVYDATIEQSKVIAVIVNSTVRVSGLIAAEEDNQKHLIELGKDFNEVTDVACEAGVTALTTGALSADAFTRTRILNLEAGAATVLATGQVNFRDPASVTAAAAAVRDLTDDGDHPPTAQ